MGNSLHDHVRGKLHLCVEIIPFRKVLPAVELRAEPLHRFGPLRHLRPQIVCIFIDREQCTEIEQET